MLVFLEIPELPAVVQAVELKMSRPALEQTLGQELFSGLQGLG